MPILAHLYTAGRSLFYRRILLQLIKVANIFPGQFCSADVFPFSQFPQTTGKSPRDNGTFWGTTSDDSWDLNHTDATVSDGRAASAHRRRCEVGLSCWCTVEKKLCRDQNNRRLFQYLCCRRHEYNHAVRISNQYQLRKILRVSWTAKKTIESVRNKAGVKRELLDTVKATKLAYYMVTPWGNKEVAWRKR